MTKESEEHRLLQTIYNDPDNDIPRLVFADWLEENGDPDWAEFIRVSCELERLNEADPTIELVALQKRQHSLQAKLRKLWDTTRNKPNHNVNWDRGFLTIEGKPERFSKEQARLWWQDQNSRVAKVTLESKKFKTGTHNSLPIEVAERVTGLVRDGRGVCQEEELKEIASYTNLRALEYHIYDIHCKTAFEPLASLEKLDRLLLYGEPVSLGVAQSLLALPNLRNLVLHRFTEETLSGVRLLGQLESLGVGVGNVQDVGPTLTLEHLEGLQKLQRLSLSEEEPIFLRDVCDNQSTNADTPPPFPALPELRELHWSTRKVNLNNLVNSQLEKLTLAFRHHWAKQHLTSTLTTLPILPKLRELRILGRWEGQEGAVLAGFPRLEKLVFNPVHLESQQAAKWPKVPQLKVLSVEEHGSYLRDPHDRYKLLEVFADRFPNIETLSVTDLGSESFYIDVSRFQHLRRLKIGRSFGFIPNEARPGTVPGVEFLDFQNPHGYELLVPLAHFPDLKLLVCPNLSKENSKEVKKHYPDLTTFVP
ncbi:MAG: TIGR02996 domain-containing protein [Gemmataceae bacterium]